MSSKIARPHNYPQRGDFYYHFKHDPEGTVNNKAYQIVGVGKGTDKLMPDAEVDYAPLYDANEHLGGADYFSRSLQSFLEPANNEGKMMPRFTKITDEATIDQLQKIQKEMYGD